MMRRASATVCLGIVLAGCSSAGNPDEPGLGNGSDGVRAVLSALTKAMAEANGGRACSLLDPLAQQRLTASMQTSDCLSAVDAWTTQHPNAKAADADSITVEVQGTNATASATDMAPLSTNGVWKLATVESRWTVV